MIALISHNQYVAEAVTPSKTSNSSTQWRFDIRTFNMQMSLFAKQNDTKVHTQLNA